MYHYVIELYNTTTRKYERIWYGTNQECADTMMKKSYYSHSTRRLIRIQTEILYTEKAKKK